MSQTYTITFSQQEFFKFTTVMNQLTLIPKYTEELGRNKGMCFVLRKLVNFAIGLGEEFKGDFVISFTKEEIIYLSGLCGWFLMNAYPIQFSEPKEIATLSQKVKVVFLGLGDDFLNNISPN